MTQPPPKKTNLEPTWNLVIEDMKKRNQEGIEKYGVPLTPNNGRSSLQDLYEELLDAVVYTKNMIEEEKIRGDGD